MNSKLKMKPVHTLRNIMHQAHIRQLVQTDAGPRVVIEPLQFLRVAKSLWKDEVRVVR